MLNVGAIRDQRRLWTQTAEAVPEACGDHRAPVVVWATQLHRVDGSTGWRVPAIIPDGEPHASYGNREVLGLSPVALPGLDGAGDNF